MMRSIELVVVVILASTAANALYSSGDEVIELTAANFNSKVIQSSDLWLVEFYAPWYIIRYILSKFMHQFY
jgi:thioredoxin-like negative regulator of GroEL